MRAVSLAAARGAFCAALSNGEAWRWGANGEGILGAEVWCWGRGGDGLLGTGSLDDLREPTAVEGLRDAEFVAVGSYLACTVRRGGAVSCWGRLPGARTAAREPTPRPTAIESFRDAVEVGAGNNLACARTRGGAVQCVGAATHLGGAPADGTAVAVPGVSGATSLAVGEFEACAVGARTVVISTSIACGDGSARGQYHRFCIDLSMPGAAGFTTRVIADGPVTARYRTEGPTFASDNVNIAATFEAGVLVGGAFRQVPVPFDRSLFTSVPSGSRYRCTADTLEFDIPTPNGTRLLRYRR